MGMLESEILKFLKIAKNDGIHGKNIALIGKQDIIVNLNRFLRTLSDVKIEYNIAIAKEIEAEEHIDAFKFFTMLGFESVYAIDYSDYEGANIIFDLNDELPDDLNGRFDYVINGGTLEHVFDVSRAMINMSKMVKNGGMIMHISPAVGWVDHGFYSISPTFFQDYYGVNGFEIDTLQFECIIPGLGATNHAVFSEDIRLLKGVSEINEYISVLQQIKDVKKILLLAIAKKINDIEEHKKPIQGFYENLYGNGKNKVLVSNIKFKKWAEEIANSSKSIALYGSGNVCNLLQNELYKVGAKTKIGAIFDGNAQKAGTMMRGTMIEYPRVERIDNFDVIYICSADCEDEIVNTLMSMGLEAEKIKRTSDYT